jgi:hypothetical protein
MCFCTTVAGNDEKSMVAQLLLSGLNGCISKQGELL